MPAFRSEGLTDDMARDLALVDLKALGLGTMSHALQFKSHVAEFLSGASIEKPHAAAASGVSGDADAAVPSAPPIDDDCSDVLSFARSISDIPTDLTDQLNPKPATPAPPPRSSLIRIRALRYFTMELLQDPVFAADGFTYTPPCPPLLLSSLQSRLPSPPSPFQIRTQQHAAMAGPRPQHQSQKRGVVAQHSAGAKS